MIRPHRMSMPYADGRTNRVAERQVKRLRALTCVMRELGRITLHARWLTVPLRVTSSPAPPLAYVCRGAAQAERMVPGRTERQGGTHRSEIHSGS